MCDSTNRQRVPTYEMHAAFTPRHAPTNVMLTVPNPDDRTQRGCGFISFKPFNLHV